MLGPPLIRSRSTASLSFRHVLEFPVSKGGFRSSPVRRGLLVILKILFTMWRSQRRDDVTYWEDGIFLQVNKAKTLGSGYVECLFYIPQRHVTCAPYAMWALPVILHWGNFSFKIVIFYVHRKKLCDLVCGRFFYIFNNNICTQNSAHRKGNKYSRKNFYILFLLVFFKRMVLPTLWRKLGNRHVETFIHAKKIGGSTGFPFHIISIIITRVFVACRMVT